MVPVGRALATGAMKIATDAQATKTDARATVRGYKNKKKKKGREERKAISLFQMQESKEGTTGTTIAGTGGWVGGEGQGRLGVGRGFACEGCGGWGFVVYYGCNTLPDVRAR